MATPKGDMMSTCHHEEIRHVLVGHPLEDAIMEVLSKADDMYDEYQKELAHAEERIDELEDVVLSGINLVRGLAGVKLEGVAELSYKLFVESIKEAYRIED